MAESSTANREETQPWPFLYMLGAVAAIVALAVAWFYLRNADLTLPWFVGTAMIGIAALALYALLGVWVYQDARQIGVPAIPWVIVVLLLFVFGLAVYLVMREFKPDKRPGNHE